MKSISEKDKLKDLLDKNGFLLIDKRLGIEVYGNSRGEKVFFDENGDLYEHDLLSKTKKKIEKILERRI